MMEAKTFAKNFTKKHFKLSKDPNRTVITFIRTVITFIRTVITFIRTVVTLYYTVERQLSE